MKVVPVLGSEAGVSVSQKRCGGCSRGLCFIRTLHSTQAPSLSTTAALETALQAAESPADAAGEPALWVVPSEDGELTYRLAWAVPLVGNDVETLLIDAHTGSVLSSLHGTSLAQVDQESATVPATPTPPHTAQSATIEGYVTLNYSTSPDDPYGSLKKHYNKPFKYAKVILNQGGTTRITYADANGFYRFDGLVFGTSHAITFEMANDRAYILSGIPLHKRSKSTTVTTNAGYQTRGTMIGVGEMMATVTIPIRLWA